MVSRYIAAFAVLATTVAAHGNIISPQERIPGPAMAAACGQAAVNSAKADPGNPLEDIDVSGATPACQLNFCRGAVFSDQPATSLQTYTAGQTVRFQAALPIPHAGPMNVSVIDIATNKAITQPLIYDPNYADETLPQLPANNTNFSFKMPQLAANTCTQPGQCTLQWFWFGTRAQQTYESCIDFVMAPSGSTAVAAAQPAGSAVAGGKAVSGAVSFVYKPRMFRA